jgi:predicted transcriptional regulator
MEKTTIYLPEDLHRALREAACAENKAQAEVIRRALEEYLERRERALPLSIGLEQDSGLSGAGSEAWLEAEWGRR